eukprot:1957977-Ditylum_brightwellii.AAC.1
MGGYMGHEANTLPFMEEMKNEIAHCSQKALVNLTTALHLSTIGLFQNSANFIGRKKDYINILH